MGDDAFSHPRGALAGTPWRAIARASVFGGLAAPNGEKIPRTGTDFVPVPVVKTGFSTVVVENPVNFDRDLNQGSLGGLATTRKGFRALAPTHSGRIWTHMGRI